MKKYLIAIFIVLGILIPVGNIHAQPQTNQIKIEIVDAQTAKMEIDFNLKDNSNVNYLTGFELSFPFEISGEVAGQINDQALNISKQTSESSSTIKISTENLNINLSSDTWLKLNFQLKNLTKKKFGIDYLYFPPIENNFALSAIQYDVTYPTDFGKLSFVSASVPDFKSETQVVASVDKSLFMIWGDSPQVNLKMSYTVKNDTETDSTYLLNLPANLNQSVSYNEFPKAEGGLFDNLYNNFAVKNVTAKQSAAMNLNADITLSNKETQTVNVEKYGWNLNADSTFSKNLIAELAKVTTAKDRIMTIDKYLVNNLSPYASEKYELDSLKDIWGKLNGVSQFNSVEYCYLAISAAEYLGYKGHLAYGYLILPDFLLSEKRSPHVWCEIYDGSKTYFLDPFLEDQFRLSYNLVQPKDRILFGNWDTSMTYNNILGLANNDSQEIQAEISEVSTKLESDNNLAFIFKPVSNDLYSGDYYAADISIENKSKYFLQLRDVKIDGTSYISTLGIKTFNPALLPQKATVFTFDNLIQSNLLFNGNKNLKIEVQSDANFDQSALSFSQDVFFKISIGNILKELIVIGVVVVILVVIFKFFIQKRVLKLFKRNAVAIGENNIKPE